jgi:hypothetical protein
MGWLSDVTGGAIDDSGGGINLNAEGIANAFLNVGTGGTVGYKDGKFSQGFIVNALSESFGEITGRNAMRQSLNDQRNALQAYNDQQKQLMLDEQKRQYQNDLIASRAAGGQMIGSSPMGTNKGGAGDVFNPVDLYLGGR